MNQETWKDVPGYEGTYQASNLGQIRSHKKGRYKTLKQAQQPSGYKSVCLSKNGKVKTFSVHRLVYRAFNPKEDLTSKVINHIDWDKTNNNLNNLESVTVSQNILHGSGPTELKKLEAMLCNSIKKALKEWYTELRNVEATKEAWTEKVVEDAVRNATEYFTNKNII